MVMSLAANVDEYDSGLQFIEHEGVGHISFGSEGRGIIDPILIMEDLLSILNEMKIARSVKVLVLSIGGEGTQFDTNVLGVGGMSTETAQYYSLLCSDVYRHLASLPKPTIAAVEGDCFGMGLELILHCDLRVVTDQSRFGLTGMNFGLAPNGAGLARLAQLVGESHARMMGLTGAMVSADRAFVMGFVTNVLAEKDFKAGVNMLSTHLASLSETALRETKELIDTFPILEHAHLGQQSAEALGKCISAKSADKAGYEMEFDLEGATVH